MASNKYGYMARIGVDTSGMADADSEIRQLSGELRAVDNIIRQSGNSSEMAAQRQEILAQQIRITTERLQQLRNAQQAIENGVNAGTISAEQYREYQREVTSTQGALERLREQQRSLGQSAERDLGKITNTLKNIEKVALASTAAVAAALTKLSSEALAAYSQYEQLVGGVETLFAGADDIVMKNAENAFKTAGISANNYMQTVTGFSATLLQGLGGDTKKAAEIADKALIDMADNANKMGTAMGSIQYAYQGFAKQNYTMLDNLKLGYGGSQAEMARLINDSGVLNGEIKATAENVKEIPFDKIIEAIHKIQENLGITGTTALEAETTIEGSMNKLKASWENALVEIARPLDDFAMGGLTILNDNIDVIRDTLAKVTEELKPILDGMLARLENFIERGGLEKLADNVVNLIGFISDNKEMLLGLFVALEVALGADRIKTVITKFKDIKDTVTNVAAAFNGAGTAVESSMQRIITAITGAESTVTVSLGAIAAAAAATVAAIASAIAIADELNTIADAMLYESVEAQKSKSNVDEMTKQWEDLDNMRGLDRYNAALDYKEDILEREENWNKRYKDVVDELGELQGKKVKNASETARQKELENTKETLDAEWAMIELFNTKVDNELSNYTAESVGKLQEAGAAQNQSITKAGRTNEETLGEVWDKIRETTNAKMGEFDSLLATHKITEDEYWSQRKEYLESHRDEESEEWWRYYDEVTKHYEDAADKEEEAAEKYAENSKKTTENSVKKSMENLRRLQKEQGLDDKWLEQQYLILANSLEKGTEAYNTAYDAYLDIREKNQKAEAEAAEEEKKQIEEEAKAKGKALKEAAETEIKAREEREKAIESAARDYEKSGSELSEKVTSNGKERLVLSDLNAESKKLERYNESKEKLRALGVSEALLETVNQYDYKDGSRQMYLDELLGMGTGRLQKYDREYNEYLKKLNETAENDIGETAAETASEVGENLLTGFKEYNKLLNEQGGEAAASWLSGFKSGFGDVDINSLADVLGWNTGGSAKSKNAAGTSSAVTDSAAASAAEKSISPSTVLSINVAGTEVIRGTLEEFLRDKILGGQF